MQWITLFKKEMIENWRNFKWIWVPLVITLLAVIDPITSYYMPIILDTIGGLPEGALFEIPEPSPIEGMMMSLNQLNSLGVLIIIFISMGSIAGEKKSGVSELILVKPVNYFHYITSKWASMVLIITIALMIGLTMSWYYVNLLFGEILLSSLVQMIFFYGLWFVCIITLSIFYGTVFNRPGLVAALTIATAIGMSIVTSFFGKYLLWSPNNLTNHLQKTLVSRQLSFDLLITAMVTIIFISLLLFASYTVFQRREINQE